MQNMGEVEKEATLITDLTNDCLGCILEHLDW